VSRPLTGDDAAAVTLTVGQLRAIVAEAVDQALDAREAKPAILDLKGICAALSVSERTLLDLRKAGMPHTFAGDSPRFVVSEVLDWLKAKDVRAVVAELQRLSTERGAPSTIEDVFARVAESGLRVGQSVELKGGLRVSREPKSKK
jgi:hypothetical protein